jgi:hypothetical protein
MFYAFVSMTKEYFKASWGAYEARQKYKEALQADLVATARLEDVVQKAKAKAQAEGRSVSPEVKAAEEMLAVTPCKSALERALQELESPNPTPPSTAPEKFA